MEIPYQERHTVGFGVEVGKPIHLQILCQRATKHYYLFIIVIFIFIYIYILLINNVLYLFIIIYNTLPLVPFWDLFALPPWTLASFLSLLCSSTLPGLSVCPCVLLQEYTSQVQSLVQPY